MREAGTYAVAIDRMGKLHVAKPDIGGDPLILLLGAQAPDAHLAELAADGISYCVVAGEAIDPGAALAMRRQSFGIERLPLEGGAAINGAFFAAGLVDALSVVVTPTLDAGLDAQGIVAYDGGLKGKVRLALAGVERLDHCAVHVRYRVER